MKKLTRSVRNLLHKYRFNLDLRKLAISVMTAGWLGIVVGGDQVTLLEGFVLFATGCALWWYASHTAAERDDEDRQD
ncbi:MAG: hypothetical protein OES46_11175 [Gammaproteobacteria bacterium]|nr:hypothetical protein [Gammaproteobacteria bacterium]